MILHSLHCIVRDKMKGRTCISPALQKCVIMSLEMQMHIDQCLFHELLIKHIGSSLEATQMFLKGRTINPHFLILVISLYNLY